jgi:hypothetical protein
MRLVAQAVMRLVAQAALISQTAISQFRFKTQETHA